MSLLSYTLKKRPSHQTYIPLWPEYYTTLVLVLATH